MAISEDLSCDDATDAIGGFIAALANEGGRDSFWLQVYRHWKDKPENIPEGKDQKERKARKEKICKLNNLHRMSMSKLMGLSDEDYTSALQTAKIMVLRRNRHGVKLNFQLEHFKEILIKHGMEMGKEYELDLSMAPGSNASVYYLRIGKKVSGYYTSVEAQVKKKMFSPPRYRDIDQVRRRLRMALTGRDAPDPIDSSMVDGLDPTSESGSDSEPDDPVYAGRSSDPSRPGVKYPRLHKLGVNTDLSNPEAAENVKLLIGELFALQQAHSGKMATNVYTKLNSRHTIYAVSILPHSSEESYQRYHLKTPYFEEMFAVIEKCPGANGPTRVGTYIAKKHKEVFANVGKANGYNYGTKMDEIASAAMWRDARVLDWQAETVLRHLRYHFEEDITVGASC